MSRLALAERQARLPPLIWQDGLPINDHLEDIRRLIEQHPVVIVAGETGSGKTTQLPKICLAAGRGLHGLIGHTQPRRIAARSVAARLVEELGATGSQCVGYQVRFTDTTPANAFIKVMTDGILLANIQRDRYLRAYDTLIIDEAHERSLNIDFLLGYLKQLLPKRPDLRIIITSATIAVDRFSDFFGQAPVVQVSSRTYPVDLRYRPGRRADEAQEAGNKVTDEADDDQLLSSVLACLEEVSDYERASGLRSGEQGPGDLLVFLPGEREIRALSKSLRHLQPSQAANGKGRGLQHLEVVPLYARLSAQEQNRVFSPHTGRRLVLATNVAETSLTVPGIRYVIDTGLARVSRYSVHSKLRRLPIEAISQASANQRAGRCGRVAPGICFRLFDEPDFLARPLYTDPEIRRTDLSAVILQMQALGLGEVISFPFLDPPDQRQINDGYKLLEELGAVTPDRRLTATGRQMARLPVDPRLARILLAGAAQGCLDQLLVICAALTLQDPRDRPADRQQAADQAHAAYADRESDFVSYLRLWAHVEAQHEQLSQSAMRRYCEKHFLSWIRLREWREIHRQLLLLTREQGLLKQHNQAETTEKGQPQGARLPEDEPFLSPSAYESVHRALLCGFLGQVARKHENREYQATRNRKVMIFPGSRVAKTQPQWLLASEMLETSRVYARGVARIEPTWIEPVAAHLVKRHYSEPHWERKRAQVVGYERVSLYGLDIIPRRPVNYAQVDPAEARRIFIRSALVAGDYDSKAPFLAANQARIEDVMALEAKTRRRDLLIDEETLFQFYDARLPSDIVSGRHFDAWWKQAAPAQLQSLQIRDEDLLQRDLTTDAAVDFPDQLVCGQVAYRLLYEFEPTSAADGVTLVTPLIALRQLPAYRLQWLVPGLLREKAIAMVKGLPKAIRKNFVPVPDFTDAALANLTACDEPLGIKLGEQLTRMTGVRIDPNAWQPDAVPLYLRMNVRMLDEQGQPIEESRDIQALLSRYADAASATLSRPLATAPTRAATHFREWQFGDLPPVVQSEQQGVRVTFYPMIEDQGGEVQLTRALDVYTAKMTSRRGIARLLLNRLYAGRDGRKGLDDIERRLPSFHQSALLFAPVGQKQALLDDLLIAAVQQHFLPLPADTDAAQADDLPRSAAALAACYDAHRGDFQQTLEACDSLLASLLQGWHPLMKALKGKVPLPLAQSYADLKLQLDQLIYPGCLAQTPWYWLKHLPRYLQAAAVRLEKMPRELGRERSFLHLFQPLWAACQQRDKLLQQRGQRCPELETYRWLLEEFRVSYFAQQLGTERPVSEKRLERQWQKVRI